MVDKYNIKKSKEQSTVAIITELKKHVSLTKQELARILGISFSSISMLCRSLEKSNYIIVKDGDSSTGGRKPSNIILNNDYGYFIFISFSYPIDILKIEILNFNTDIIDKTIISFKDKNTLESLIEDIEFGIKNIFSKNDKNIEMLLGISLSIPGVFDKKRNVTFTLNKMIINSVRLGERIKEKFKTIVIVENDANLVALGYEDDINTKAGDMLMIYFTHGIGMGIINNGRILTGRAGYAGEIGHIRSIEGELECDFCRSKGCLQTVATIRYMIYEYYDYKITMKKVLEEQDKLLERFIESINQNDVKAIKILEKAGRAIGDFIGSLIDIFNPEIIGLSGYNIEYLRKCIEVIRLYARKRSYIIHDNDTPIEIVSNHEKLMTKGAAKVIFLEWLKNTSDLGI